MTEREKLADRLRWIYQQPFITLALATEICNTHLSKIIHFLDEPSSPPIPDGQIAREATESTLQECLKIIRYQRDQAGTPDGKINCAAIEDAVMRWGRNALAALALPDQRVSGWRDIATAPKNGTRVLVYLKTPIPAPGRPDLEKWHGIPFVARHPGLADDGFDMGWNFAAPVGHGGFPDEWIAGWQPLPVPPEQRGQNESE